MTKKAPTSHAELLKQAVVSRDFDKYTTVLRNIGKDTTSMRVTIQDLDASLIIPTLKYVNEIFCDDTLRERTTFARDFRSSVDFMELLLEIHSGYLSTITNLDKQLGSLIEFAQARAANIEKLNKLAGCLSFVSDQVKMRSTSATFGQQKEEIFFEDSGRHMKRASRKAANEDQQMDVS